jgi:hypothetical protein
LYLERWRLLEELAPETQPRIQAILATKDGKISIVTSMQYFKGPHPEEEETKNFIESLGFEPWQDNTLTLDYIHKKAGIIIRDCHSKNWIKSHNTLIPIDIIPKIREP